MGILPGSDPSGSGPTGPGSGFSVMPTLGTITTKTVLRYRMMSSDWSIKQIEHISLAEI